MAVLDPSKSTAEGVDGLAVTTDIERIEAPVTWKAYLMCAFAALGGIFYGYDTGYISNIDAMAVSCPSRPTLCFAGITPSPRGRVKGGDSNMLTYY